MDDPAPLPTDADAQAPGAKEKLFSKPYVELHRLARRRLQNGKGVELSPTTLPHGTCLGMIQGQAAVSRR